jgi:hypothetical protein
LTYRISADVNAHRTWHGRGDCGTADAVFDGAERSADGCGATARTTGDCGSAAGDRDHNLNELGFITAITAITAHKLDRHVNRLAHN